MTTTVRRHEKLLGQVRKRHAKDVGVWRVTSAENAHRLINGMVVAKADSPNMSVEKNMVLTRFEDYVRTLQVLSNANVERKVKLTDAITMVRELL